MQRKKLKFVLVNWKDAIISGVENHDKYIKDGGIMTASIGFLVADNKKGVTLAQTIDVDDQFSDQLTIPRKMVESVIISEEIEDVYEAESENEEKGTPDFF